MRPIDADELRKELIHGHDLIGAKYVDLAPTIDAMSEWIPCSERLPKESEQDSELGVLVTLGNGYSGIQFDWVRDGEHWYDWDGYVIAWMPLPKPYGERKESE